ncbi:hypothetical protein C4K09_5962 [Pseudomonas chlororaphis subsp. aureofaciens]|nr:hypothetical protein C4K09_5962 [Pseudomonas chlororaphis subsp. aureofaciens]
MSRWNRQPAGSVRKVAALGHAALKTGSECSFRLLNSASSPVFALPDLRSPTFHTDPRPGRRVTKCFKPVAGPHYSCR